MALLQWGTEGSPAEVVLISPTCPGKDAVSVTAHRRLPTLRLTPPGADKPYVGAALVPLGSTPLGLVVVREDGPALHRSELWRLEQIGNVVGAVLALA